MFYNIGPGDNVKHFLCVSNVKVDKLESLSLTICLRLVYHLVVRPKAEANTLAYLSLLQYQKIVLLHEHKDLKLKVI